MALIILLLFGFGILLVYAGLTGTTLQNILELIKGN